jgi:hypothetical protein
VFSLLYYCLQEDNFGIGSFKNADRLQKLTEECQNKSAAAAMDNAKADLGLIGQIVTGLSYTIKHQNISSATALIFAYHRNGRHNLQTDEFADINFGQISHITKMSSFNRMNCAPK